MRYFEGFLPRLAADGPDITMYFQMKANLRPEQLTLLSRARHQEDPARHRIAEHAAPRASWTRAAPRLQNVQVLKLAAEAGLYVEWNLLYGFPGERATTTTRRWRR